jgi:hypothetical protein
MPQRLYRTGGFIGCIDDIFRQRTDDTLETGIDFADPAFVLARGLYDAAGGGVDNGRNATGLGV